MAGSKIPLAAYWACTLPVAFENAAGATWTFSPLIPGINRLHEVSVFAAYLSGMLAHLGYPQYFKYILGPWQLACAAALVAPSLARAKEWAYTGAFINYSSAVLSHWFAGDRPDIPAAVMAVFTIISWALRPPNRRLSASIAEATSSSWIRAAIVLAVLFVLSFFWLPRMADH